MVVGILLEQVFHQRSQFLLVEFLIGPKEVGLRPHHHAYLRGGRARRRSRDQGSKVERGGGGGVWREGDENGEGRGGDGKGRGKGRVYGKGERRGSM